MHVAGLLSLALTWLCTTFALKLNLRMSGDALMHGEYDALARHLLDQRREGAQFWVGIAGGPGSGKSTLAAAVASRLNEMCGSEVATVLPMDGFHYSRAELRQIAESSAGRKTFEDLIARRGSPWTFDAAKICTQLSAAKSAGEAVLPTYSRQKSDPVPGGVELRRSHALVLCEGNYLFNWDEPEWSGLRDVFDEKWFISCADLAGQRERLVKRHLETWTDEKTAMWGPGREGAAKKADSNDVLNAEFVERTSKKWADRVIISRG